MTGMRAGGSMISMTLGRRDHPSRPEREVREGAAPLSASAVAAEFEALPIGTPFPLPVSYGKLSFSLVSQSNRMRGTTLVAVCCCTHGQPQSSSYSSSRRHYRFFFLGSDGPDWISVVFDRIRV